MHNMTHKKAILIVFGSMIISLIIFIPKIYFRNNIYYISKDINKLHVQYISLQEEYKFLKQQHEDAVFKNQIMDSLILENFDK